MDGKRRHRPGTSWGVQYSKNPFSGSNYSNNGEVRICLAAIHCSVFSPYLEF